MLPLSFNDSKYNEHIDRTGAAVAAAVFIGAGYALPIMLLAAQFRDRDYVVYSLILWVDSIRSAALSSFSKAIQV